MVQRVFTVTEPSQVGEVRRAVLALARQLGFNETDCGRAATVATEVSSNLVKHAREGRVLLQSLLNGPPQGQLPVAGNTIAWTGDGPEAESVPVIEILALDRGPGMVEPGRCLRDGYSTAGTPGSGLGAVVRLSTFTDLYSRCPQGTALVARLSAGTPAPAPVRWSAGAINLPKRGEEVSGDAWATAEVDGRTLFVVADGLGHGPLAADASRVAVEIFQTHSSLAPAALLQRMHGALRATRGAAVAVALVDPAAATIRFAGMGNIAGTVLSNGGSQSMVSCNGTLGHEVSRFQEFSYPFLPGAALVMHSDGLLSRWSLDSSPGLLQHDPLLVAGVLYRDFERGRDDVTVLVARLNEDD